MERVNPKCALYLMECVFEADTSQNLIQRDLGGETVTDGVVTPVQDLIIKLATDQVKSGLQLSNKMKTSQLTLLTVVTESIIYFYLKSVAENKGGCRQMLLLLQGKE